MTDPFNSKLIKERMEIKSFKSKKWIEFKERYGLSKHVELVDVANAFYAGYAEGYTKASEDSCEKSQEQTKEANEIIAYLCRKLDEAKFEREYGLKIATGSILHKEISYYVEKYKIKK